MLKNAGAAFVRAVRNILLPICDFSESYFNDIGVGSYHWSHHMGHIRQFVSIVKQVGMPLSAILRSPM